MSGAFLGLEPQWSGLDEARFAVLRAPYDGTSTWLKGADHGPEAILDASHHLELYDIETDSEPFREGIYTHDEPATGETPEGAVSRVEESVGRFLRQGKLPIVIGGEHTVTVGAVRAAASLHPGLSVLQLDAHTDLRDEYEGSRYNHACVMARVAEHCPSVQVGIRSMDAGEKPALVRDRVFFARDLEEDGAWVERVVELLSDEVYLTFDLDVFDPSLMPATGTPEPGGLGWYDALRLLREVARRRRLIAFDVVELCPDATGSPVSAFTAAKLVYKIIAYICAASASRAEGE